MSRIRPGRRGESGYTLLVLIGMLTVFGIALGAALPHWRAAIQREKEAELVARGLQMAEGLRVFNARFGRLPTALAELIESEPRSLRRLFKDPMTQGGDWLLLMEGPGGILVTIDPESGEIVGAPGAGDDAGLEEESGEGPAAAPPAGARGAGDKNAPGGGVLVAGPIHGVKSRAHGEAYRVFFDSKDFGDWQFTVERLQAATQATGPDGILRRADYASIGRPFRYPPPGGLAGMNPTPPGGQKPNRPGKGGKPPRPAIEEQPEEPQEETE